MLRTIFIDAAYAVRTMARKPVLPSVIILTLAIGMGANIAVFSTVLQSLIRPLPFPNPEQLVFGRCTIRGYLNPLVSAPDFYDYRDQTTTFESLSAIVGFTRNQTVTGAEEPEQVTGTIVTWDLFKSLGVNLHLGRHFSAEEGHDGAADVAVISFGYWQRRFGGSPKVVGQSLVVDGAPHTVVGVMPAGFTFLFPIDIWVPMRESSPWTSERRFHNWLLVGRVRAGVTIEEAQSQIDVISARLEKEYPSTNKEKGLLLTDLHDVLVAGYRPSLLLLMGAISLVLAVACANVAGLLLARGAARRGELAIRAALGAPRWRITGLLLTEAVMMALVAGVVGTFLALWLERLIVEFMSIEVPGGAQGGITATSLAFALGLSVVTGAFFGIVPALRSARSDVVQDLKVGGRRGNGSGGGSVRSGLVIAQVALSVMLLIGSGLLLRSFSHLRSVEPGFDAGELLTAEIRIPETDYPESGRRIQFFSRLLEETRSLPAVVAAGLINRLPIRNPGNNTYVHAADDPPTDQSERRVAFQRFIFPGYFRAMGIPLLAGRGIEETDREATARVLVINETMAETLFPGVNPVGRMVVADFSEPVTAEVVGVVGDVRMSGLSNQPRLAMYGSYRQRPSYSTMRIAIRVRDGAESVADAFRRVVWNLDGNVPVVELASMNDVIDHTLAGRRNVALSLGLFAAVAVLLATIGLYGILAYYVSQRRYEIGVRIAFGAKSGNIVSLVLSRGMGLVAIGLVVGLAGSFAATRLIQSLLYGVSSTDPLTFVSISLFFGLVASAVCLLPALRAVRIDPVVALQAE